MSISPGASVRLSFTRLIAAAAAAAVLVFTGGCASHYVDAATRDRTSEFQRPASPAPVQLVFQFETKGAPNSRATDHLKSRVSEQVKGSGLFSSVQDIAVPGGALLSVTINNVPMSDDAFSKGFVTGLTFGLAGSQVSDGYVCTVKYMPGSGEPVVKTARHVIHTTVGASASPGNAVKAKDIEEAVTLMTKQLLSTALNDLSHDPAFR